MQKVSVRCPARTRDARCFVLTFLGLETPALLDDVSERRGRAVERPVCLVQALQDIHGTGAAHRSVCVGMRGSVSPVEDVVLVASQDER